MSEPGPSNVEPRLPRLPVVERATFLVEAIRGRSVLSIGLGGYADARSYSFSLASTDPRTTLSGRLAASAGSITFADLSEDAITAFRPHVPATYHCVDITSPIESWPAALAAERFDVVVIGEVIEHLDNPGAALRNLHGLVTDGGRLIVTVPNAYALAAMVRIVTGRETTHPEHTSHYSYLTLNRLLAMSSLPPAEILWYRWARFGGDGVARAKRAASTLVSRLLPQVSHGLVAVVPG